MESDDELITQLLSVRDDIAAAMAKCQIIDDVLDDKILSRGNRKTKELQVGPIKVAFVEAPGPLNLPDEWIMAGAQLYYLPKGKLENIGEYRQRIAMTPTFFKTPKILNDRQGALNSELPKIVGDNADELEDFEQSATVDNHALPVVISKVAELIQRHGLVAIFVNRAVLPFDVIARNGVVTEAEKTERGLGVPKLVVYTGKQILSFKRDADGLQWIKVAEKTTEQDAWNTPIKNVTIVRIFDRVNIVSYKITESEGKRTVAAPQTFPHGYTDYATKRPAVPVVIGAPFCGEQEVGRPMLRGSAMADVAATQILSDLRWTLFVLGNPLLTFTTSREKEELEEFQAGAGRYITLQKGDGINEPESMAYVQLDPTGLMMLREMYERFVTESEAQAGQDTADSSVSVKPSPNGQTQSGISKAWEFKTGEERVLLLITYELYQIFKPVLSMVASMLNVDPSTVGLEFNDEFDIEDPKAANENTTAALQISDKYQLTKTRTRILKKWKNSILPDLTEEDDSELDDEIEEAESIEPVQPVVPGQEVDENGQPIKQNNFGGNKPPVNSGDKSKVA